MKDENIIYTDGSSRGNPGPGGWGAVILHKEKVTEVGGGEKKTTNNRMELNALLKSLEHLVKLSGKTKPNVSIFTDSSYVINGSKTWIAGWKKNGWKTSQKTDVVNKDLWEPLDEVLGKVHATWNHVKGHVGIPGNERCDQIATGFADGLDVDLYNGDKKHYRVDLSVPDNSKLDKPASRDKSRAKAFSYLSLVDGDLQKHTTWADCENRVKGIGGEKLKKSIRKEDEENILKGWGVEN